MKINKLLLVYDTDVLAYKATSACEKEVQWNESLFTVHSDLNESIDKFKELLGYATKRCLTKLKHKGPYDMKLVFSDKHNFRKVILPTYKANRQGKRKPCAYYGLKKWIEENYDCVSMPYLEGDDVCSIIAESYEGEAVILSIDKDMKTCAAKYFDFNNEVLYEPSKESAEYWWFKQTLTGDVCDGYGS